MQKFIVLTVLIITVYQLDAQTKLITVEKGDTILVGADMKIVIPNKQKARTIVKKEYVEPKVINIQLPEYEQQHILPVPYPGYPVKYQDQPVEPRYDYNPNQLPIVLGILGLVAGIGSLFLVFAERGRRKDEYHIPPSTNNTFHVSGGHVDSSKHEHNDLHDSRTYGEPDMNTANAVVKMWREEEKIKKENFLRKDDSEADNRNFTE